MAGSGETSEEDDTTPGAARRPSNGTDNGSVRSTRSASKAKAKGKTPAKKKRPREDNGNESDNDKVDDNGVAVKPKPQKKRKRVVSPKPPTGKAAKKKKEDDVEDAEVEADSEMEEEPEEDAKRSPDEVAAAAAASADSKPPAAAADNVEQQGSAGAKKATTKKVADPNLKILAHQTPGKRTRGAASTQQPQSTSNANEVAAPPGRKLMFSAPTPPTAASSTVPDPSTAQSPVPTTNQTPTGGLETIADVPSPAMTNNAQQPPHAQAASQTAAQALRILSSLSKVPIFWCLVFIFIHLGVFYLAGDSIPEYMTIAKRSNAWVHFYKSSGYSIGLLTPPIKMVPNRTRLAEIKEIEQRRQQQKRKMLKDLEDVQKAMEREIKGMKEDTGDMTKNLETIEEQINDHKEPVVKVHEKLSRIDKLLTTVASKDGEDSNKEWSEIIGLLGEKDKSKLLDLSTLDLWEIPEIPDGCGDDFDDEEEEEEEEEEEVEDDAVMVEDEALHLAIVDEDRLSAWEKDLRSLVDTSTDEILESQDLEDQVRKWIRSELEGKIGWEKVLAGFSTEELGKLIKKAVKQSGGSLPAEAILKQIQDRLEIEIADGTGRFDYAAIHNGATIIREGPRKTSPSLRRTLPFFNRLMAQLGLRFYGHEAEAALTPTVPRDALGQCWAFQSDEAIAIKRRILKSAQDYSRGTVATLTVRLAKPTFVHSVVIEHPPREISDRMQSAIRIFRVTGYEDSIGKTGAYELGRFEYKIDGDSPVMEFPVARELSRDKVPRLQSIALAIESTWGGSVDFGCLYRFKVHGDVNE